MITWKFAPLILAAAVAFGATAVARDLWRETEFQRARIEQLQKDAQVLKTTIAAWNAFARKKEEVSHAVETVYRERIVQLPPTPAECKVDPDSDPAYALVRSMRDARDRSAADRPLP